MSRWVMRSQYPWMGHLCMLSPTTAASPTSNFVLAFFFLSWHFRAFIRPNFYRRSGLRATISVPPEALTLSFIAYANQSLPQVHRLYSISRYAFSLELESYILDNGRDTLPFGYQPDFACVYGRNSTLCRLASTGKSMMLSKTMWRTLVSINAKSEVRNRSEQVSEMLIRGLRLHSTTSKWLEPCGTYFQPMT